MPHDRFYLDAPLEKECYLEGDEFQHLSRVMRKVEGDEVELINGRHQLALAHIERIEKRGAHLTILKCEEKVPLLPPLTLVQAFPKLSNLELILQKGTELGVSTFWIFKSTLSEQKDLSENQLRRLDHIVISAMKQCGRLDRPELKWGFPDPLTGHVYIGTLRKEAPHLIELAQHPATLIIGPEKGLTEEETQKYEETAQGVTLSPYTLRAETAAIAGLSILGNQRSPLIPNAPKDNLKKLI